VIPDYATEVFEASERDVRAGIIRVLLEARDQLRVLQAQNDLLTRQLDRVYWWTAADDN